MTNENHYRVHVAATISDERYDAAPVILDKTHPDFGDDLVTLLRYTIGVLIAELSRRRGVDGVAMPDNANFHWHVTAITGGAYATVPGRAISLRWDYNTEGRKNIVGTKMLPRYLYNKAEIARSVDDAIQRITALQHLNQKELNS